LQVRRNGSLVEGGSLPAFDPDGIARTVPQAGTQSVAILVGNQTGFSVDDLDCPFMARGHAQPTSVAKSFIYLDDLTNHLSRSGRFSDKIANRQSVVR